jgi:hypothetical protein
MTSLAIARATIAVARVRAPKEGSEPIGGMSPAAQTRSAASLSTPCSESWAGLSR